MTNIEMNYYNGNSYISLRPKANFTNIDGSLTAEQIPNIPADKISGAIKSQIINYKGTTSDSVTLALNQTNPYFIVGCGEDIYNKSVNVRFSFGFFLLNQFETKMNYFYIYQNYISSSFWDIDLVCYNATVNEKTLVFSKKYFNMFKIFLNDPVTSDFSTGDSVDAFNYYDKNYSYLIIY